MIGKKNIEDFNVGGNLDTIIGKGTSFEGSFKVKSTLRVDGRVKGNITASDSLVVGKEGDIDGEVRVRNAIIGGKMQGKLIASGKVVLEANSVFSGELKTTKLVIDEGAVFDGNCAMGAVPKKERENAFPPSVETILEPQGASSEIKVAK